MTSPIAPPPLSMTGSPITVDWKALAAPIDPADIRYRPDGAAYITARVVMDRLDEVLTPNGWTATYQKLGSESNQRGATGYAVECTITIYGPSGPLHRSDVGYGYPSGGNQDPEPLKGAYSDALKRAAVHFGIGRELYDQRGGGAQTAGTGAPSGLPMPPRQQGNSQQGGKPVGSVWFDNKGDQRIQCPDHGAWYGMNWSDGRQVKCKKKLDDGSYCSYMVDTPDFDSILSDEPPSLPPGVSGQALMAELAQYRIDDGWELADLQVATGATQITPELIAKKASEGFTMKTLSQWLASIHAQRVGNEPAPQPAAPAEDWNNSFA